MFANRYSKSVLFFLTATRCTTRGTIAWELWHGNRLLAKIACVNKKMNYRANYVTKNIIANAAMLELNYAMHRCISGRGTKTIDNSITVQHFVKLHMSWGCTCWQALYHAEDEAQALPGRQARSRLLFGSSINASIQ